jgi:hypothetical protein
MEKRGLFWFMVLEVQEHSASISWLGAFAFSTHGRKWKASSTCLKEEKEPSLSDSKPILTRKVLIHT